MVKIPNFKNKALLNQALVHRSYLNENKEIITSNERLEFLGDSIISFIVSSYLYDNFKNYDEGRLTNLRSLLVNTKSLANCARELDLGSRLLLSKGEEESGGRNNQSLLADVFEALVGALFLDSGVQAVKKLLEEVLLPKTQSFVEKNMLKDPKSLLQEYIQSHKKSSPKYVVLLEEGLPHAKLFTVGAFVGEKLYGKGEGKSKQEAEEIAASNALEKLGK